MTEESSQTSAPVVVSPDDVLVFARHVAKIVGSVRADQLRAGSITEEKAAHDNACAADLVRMAENEILFDGPLLN